MRLAPPATLVMFQVTFPTPPVVFCIVRGWFLLRVGRGTWLPPPDSDVYVVMNWVSGTDCRTWVFATLEDSSWELHPTCRLNFASYNSHVHTVGSRVLTNSIRKSRLFNEPHTQLSTSCRDKQTPGSKWETSSSQLQGMATYRYMYGHVHWDATTGENFAEFLCVYHRMSEKKQKHANQVSFHPSREL